MRKNILALIFVLTLLFAVPATAIAVDGEDERESIFTNYYDNLNENQKAIYDSFSKLTPDNLTVTVTVPEVYVVANGENANFNLRQDYLNDVGIANVASEMEDPMAFWTWGNSKINATSTNSVDGKWMYTSTLEITVTMDPVYADDLSTPENELQMKIDELDKAVSDFTTSNTDPKKIVDDINKFIAHDNKIVYDPNYGTDKESPYCHDAYGALVAVSGNGNEHYAVCDGYSEAFKLLCDKYGITNAIIHGQAHQSNGTENHAWNAVKLGEKWYGEDVTWNVNSGDKYHLVGGTTKIDGVTFNASHSPGIISDMVIEVFFTPLLTNDAYPAPEPTFLDKYGSEMIFVAMTVIIIIALLAMARQK